MHSYDPKKSYTFQANANALGGHVLEPFRSIVPPQAQVSLPAVGGFATIRSGAFNLDEILSVSSAYTLVTGREVTEEDGAHATLATAVVEGFNLHEVVTADRIVAQVSITKPRNGGPHRISFGGTRFDGLRVAGQQLRPRVNAALASPKAADGDHGSPVNWPTFQHAASKQAASLVKSFESHPDKKAAAWAKLQHGWGTETTATGGHGTFSLFDGFDVPDVPGTYGHIIDIAGFGRIHFGEVLITPHSLQYVSIRVELGCPVSGQATGPSTQVAGGGGADGKH